MKCKIIVIGRDVRGIVFLPDSVNDLNLYDIALRLRYINALGILDERITKHIYIEDDVIKISNKWHHDFCLAGGVDKNLFLDIQLQLYELYERGDFTVEDSHGNRYEPAWTDIPRFMMTTHKHIKHLKHRYGKQTGSCPVPQKHDGRIRVCCVCDKKYHHELFKKILTKNNG